MALRDPRGNRFQDRSAERSGTSGPDHHVGTRFLPLNQRSAILTLAHTYYYFKSNSSANYYNNVKRLLYLRFFVEDGELNGDDVDSEFRLR
jgi:hypothetical protein